MKHLKKLNRERVTLRYIEKESYKSLQAIGKNESVHIICSEPTDIQEKISFYLEKILENINNTDDSLNIQEKIIETTNNLFVEHSRH